MGSAPISRPVSLYPKQAASHTSQVRMALRYSPEVTRILDIFRELGKCVQKEPVRTARKLTIDATREVAAEANKARNPNERGLHIKTYLEALNRFDPGAFGHQRRVATLVYKMSACLELSKEEQRRLFLAADLHDFGKIGVPAFNLFAGGPYGTLTVETKQYHLLFSLWFFGQISWLRNIVPILEYMHFFDEYPAGLKRENMTIYSQILSAADYYDALTSVRTYRQPATRGDALLEVVTDPKRSYDPSVLWALEKAVNGRFSVPPPGDEGPLVA